MSPLFLHYHCSLVKVYAEHAEDIKNKWTSMRGDLKLRCFDSATATKNIRLYGCASRDSQWIIPEWTKKTIVDSNPEVFLGMLEHRATRTLFQQAFEPFKTIKPDQNWGAELLKLAKWQKEPCCDESIVTYFVTDELVEPVSHTCKNNRKTSGFYHRFDFGPDVESIDGQEGHLMGQRQQEMCVVLALMAYEVMDFDRRLLYIPSRAKRGATEEGGPVQQPKVKLTVPQQLSIAKVALPSLIAGSFNAVSACELQLETLKSDPGCLARLASVYLLNRPDRLPDDKGKYLEKPLEGNITTALLESIVEPEQSLCAWQYIFGLLNLLRLGYDDQPFRLAIFQQLSNTFQLEYHRAKEALRRALLAASGRECFRRIPNVVDNRGNVRAAMTGTPDQLSEDFTALHSMLRLCQREITLAQSYEICCDLEHQQILERFKADKCPTRIENHAIHHLDLIVRFAHDARIILPLPQFSRNKEALFVSRVQEVDSKLLKAKGQLDILTFANPPTKLAKRKMANAALRALDDWALSVAGGSINALYEAIAEKCLARLNSQRVGRRFLDDEGFTPAQDRMRKEYEAFRVAGMFSRTGQDFEADVPGDLEPEFVPIPPSPSVTDEEALKSDAESSQKQSSVPQEQQSSNVAQAFAVLSPAQKPQVAFGKTEVPSVKTELLLRAQVKATTNLSHASEPKPLYVVPSDAATDKTSRIWTTSTPSKVKTRPSPQSPRKSKFMPVGPEVPDAGSKPTAPLQLQVSAATATTFAALFDKSAYRPSLH